jgi:hypothetical protein
LTRIDSGRFRLSEAVCMERLPVENSPEAVGASPDEDGFPRRPALVDVIQAIEYTVTG